MAIKNWFVRSEAIADKALGAIRYARYLTDKNHPNHKGKTSILNIHSKPVDIALIAIKEAYNADLVNSKKQKGGRPTSSYLQSFVFSLPVDVELNNEQWKNISKALIKDLADRLNVSTKQLLKYSSLVLHQQSNTHLNLIVCRTMDGQSFQQALTRPSTTNLLKASFNRELIRCGYNYQDYKPKAKRSKRLKRWEELTEKEKLIDDKHQSLKVVHSVIRRLNNQLKKLVLAYRTEDQKNIKRQQNRLNRTIEKLEPEELTELQKSSSLEEILQKLSQLGDETGKEIITNHNKSKLRRNL
ncbi:hypothetical protein [Vibrio aestuarianus]|uniref:Uncharacterized protein n=1 Tax=Vibrio aestuarianus TaxID=28171 RepID=A0ABM9FTH7_9VIBR|nr:hypothetical protein [Vibrio aestuarianus]EHW0655524.1 hypothetical protein [Vibrio parahaemolyticus]MDE1226528.1 hypothetical protein [Vibrio aestuarianus]MDE1257726.1 hypothetical protein [Vibrio aestuarianus]MDE1272722.1 hypothetical protein [Vibrio aestuarianus]MDE1294515.1 hypothetical protein [Vibrio aestuarianus]